MSRAVGGDAVIETKKNTGEYYSRGGEHTGKEAPVLSLLMQCETVVS
jgi:hypothetical protein